jgi:hypothetical protein
VDNDDPRATLKANLDALREHGERHPELGWPLTDTALAKAAGLGRGTVQRAFQRDVENGQVKTGVAVDTLARLAKPFGLMAHHLLVEGLVPGTTPITLVTPLEQQLEQTIQHTTKLLIERAGKVERGTRGAAAKVLKGAGRGVGGDSKGAAARPKRPLAKRP